MFSVQHRTIDGAARYAVRCSALFHMNVAALVAGDAEPPQRVRLANRPTCSPSLQ
jgi:hypothetical protein